MNPTTTITAAADDEYDQYRLTKGSDNFTVEDQGTGLLTIPETNVGMTFKSWMNAGYTITKVGTRKAADDGGLTPTEVALIMEGKKINAIKAVRERTRLGLGEAKAVVDKWCADNPARAAAAGYGRYSY